MKWGISDSQAKQLWSKQPVCVLGWLCYLYLGYIGCNLSLRLHRFKMKCFTDTLFSGLKSLIGNTRAQLFTDCRYVYINHLESKKEAGDVLKNFTDYVGIPDVITRENSGEQTTHNTELMILIKNVLRW